MTIKQQATKDYKTELNNLVNQKKEYYAFGIYGSLGIMIAIFAAKLLFNPVFILMLCDRFFNK